MKPNCSLQDLSKFEASDDKITERIAANKIAMEAKMNSTTQIDFPIQVPGHAPPVLLYSPDLRQKVQNPLVGVYSADKANHLMPPQDKRFKKKTLFSKDATCDVDSNEASQMHIEDPKTNQILGPSQVVASKNYFDGKEISRP